MTDATQTDVAARLAPARAFPKPAKPGYLFGPAFDFLTLGGGSVIVCLLIGLLLPKGIPTPQQIVLITVLMFAINQPHFAHSYQMFYRNFRAKAFGTDYAPSLRWRYVVAGLVVPALLIAFLAAGALSGSARLISYGANLMFFLVGWHYVKQGYGILIVDSVQKRLMFSNSAKTIFRINGYACWAVAWLGINHALAANDYLGIVYYTLPLPPLAYRIAIGVAIASTVAAAGSLAVQYRSKGTLPWNGVVAYLTTLYLWVVFVRFNPLVMAVVPTFHSLQYLAVVWRYQLNAGASARASGGSIAALERLLPNAVMRNLVLFVGLGVLLGWLGFMGLPRTLDWLGPYNKQIYGPGLFLFMFYIFINVHHYFLDNVMWRRGNPDVQQHIFGSAPKRS